MSEKITCRNCKNWFAVIKEENLNLPISSCPFCGIDLDDMTKEIIKHESRNTV